MAYKKWSHGLTVITSSLSFSSSCFTLAKIGANSSFFCFNISFSFKNKQIRLIFYWLCALFRLKNIDGIGFLSSILCLGFGGCVVHVVNSVNHFCLSLYFQWVMTVVLPLVLDETSCLKFKRYAKGYSIKKSIVKFWTWNGHLHWRRSIKTFICNLDIFLIYSINVLWY